MTCLAIVKHADDITLGLPALISGGIGLIITNKARSTSSKIGASLGFILGRSICVIAALAGIPCLVWNVAKIIFANCINILTLGCIKRVVRFTKKMDEHITETLSLYAYLIIQPEWAKDDNKEDPGAPADAIAAPGGAI